MSNWELPESGFVPPCLAGNLTDLELNRIIVTDRLASQEESGTSTTCKGVMDWRCEGGMVAGGSATEAGHQTALISAMANICTAHYWFQIVDGTLIKVDRLKV